MRLVSWFRKNIYYFSFAVALILTSFVFTGGGIFSANFFRLNSNTEPSELTVKVEPTVQSAQNGSSSPPSINPQSDYYIDENGNWIAGTAPKKSEPQVLTSSWCGEKKYKKWQASRCQEIRCPDYISGPRVSWYNSCEPCQSGLVQRVCTHTESRESHL